MIKIEYGNKFLKDLKRLKHTEVYFEIRKFCFELLPEFDNLTEIHDIKKIIGYKNLYRIRIGNYRIGFRYESNVII